MTSQPAERNSFLRRVTEAVVALIALIIVLPVILIAALVSYAHFRAWPFFTHDRVGWKGRDIPVTKVRTLPCSTGSHVDKYELRSVAVPAAMKQLRRLHLDELPQIAAVLRGRLSFVGPRPEMRVLHERFDTAFARERTAVRPGLTGLWQIGHGVSGLIGESPEYDLFYIRNRTARLDAWIIWRTIHKMLTGTTVGLDDVPGWVLSRSSEPVVVNSPAGVGQTGTLSYSSAASRTTVP